VLTFGGIALDRSLGLLDALEQQLIQSEVNVTKMKVDQLLARIREWFHKHGEAVVEILKGIINRRAGAKSVGGSD
jgi:hypothetical protein